MLLLSHLTISYASPGDACICTVVTDGTLKDSLCTLSSQRIPVAQLEVHPRRQACTNYFSVHKWAQKIYLPQSSVHLSPPSNKARKLKLHLSTGKAVDHILLPHIIFYLSPPGTSGFVQACQGSEHWTLGFI